MPTRRSPQSSDGSRLRLKERISVELALVLKTVAWGTPAASSVSIGCSCLGEAVAIPCIKCPVADPDDLDVVTSAATARHSDIDAHVGIVCRMADPPCCLVTA